MLACLWSKFCKKSASISASMGTKCHGFVLWVLGGNNMRGNITPGGSDEGLPDWRERRDCDGGSISFAYSGTVAWIPWVEPTTGIGIIISERRQWLHRQSGTRKKLSEVARKQLWSRGRPSRKQRRSGKSPRGSFGVRARPAAANVGVERVRWPGLPRLDTVSLT